MIIQKTIHTLCAIPGAIAVVLWIVVIAFVNALSSSRQA